MGKYGTVQSVDIPNWRNQTREIKLLDPPGGTKYNLDVLLLWSKDDVILSAGGKASITKWN